MTELVLIAAVARTGVIGDGTSIPWDYPEDHRQYRERIAGHPTIVGRRTFDQMGRVEDCHAVVLTRSPPQTDREHVSYVSSVPAAVNAVATHGDGTGYIIGGQSIYALFLPYADRALISEIPETVTGSHLFPYMSSSWDRVGTHTYDSFELIEYEQPNPQPVDATEI